MFNIYTVAAEHARDGGRNIAVAPVVHIMACICLHRVTALIDAYVRRLVASVRRWKSFVYLYLVVFLVVLPLMCHDIPNSVYFYRRRNISEAKRRIQLDNDARLNWSVNYLEMLNRTQDIPEARIASGNDARVDVAITVVTVSRNRQLVDSYKPRYLSQVVAKLLAYWRDAKVQGFRYNISLSICNVDGDPDSYEEARSLSSIVDMFNRFKERYTKIKLRRQKEKEDYVFCLNHTLTVYDPRYVFVIEDDALPTKNMFPVLQHVIGRHLDRKFVQGRLVANTDDVTYVKFFHPKWLLGYYSIDPERILGLLAFGCVCGTLLLGVYWHQKRNISNSDLYIAWFLLIAFAILVAIAIDRSNLVWLRSIFGPEFYSYVPAPSCCTPAMLFPKRGASRVINYLSRVKSTRRLGKDSILDRLLYKFGMKAYLVEPSTFIHIGLYSSLRGSIVNPWKLE